MRSASGGVTPEHPRSYGNQGNVRDSVRIKRDVLVLGQEEPVGPPQQPLQRFHRAVDVQRLRMACSYCYVPRHKGFANPITVFVNIEQILGYLERHAGRQGVKPAPNKCDPVDWVYDIGENGDCSVDATVSRNVRDLVALFARLPNAKASFATEYVNRDLLDYEPRGGTRVRFSLMPDALSRTLDVRTLRGAERVAAGQGLRGGGVRGASQLQPCRRA